MFHMLMSLNIHPHTYLHVTSIKMLIIFDRSTTNKNVCTSKAGKSNCNGNCNIEEQLAGNSTCTWSSWIWVVQRCYRYIKIIRPVTVPEDVSLVTQELLALIRCSCQRRWSLWETKMCLQKHRPLLAHFFAHAINEANHATMIIPGSISRQQTRMMRTSDAEDKKSIIIIIMLNVF